MKGDYKFINGAKELSLSQKTFEYLGVTSQCVKQKWIRHSLCPHENYSVVSGWWWQRKINVVTQIFCLITESDQMSKQNKTKKDYILELMSTS